VRDAGGILRAKAPKSDYSAVVSAMTPSIVLRAAQIALVATALAAVYEFARAVNDGESRRSADALVQLFAPSYTGNDRVAPDFALPDRSGGLHRLSSERGRVVVLHFFSRTCPPCIHELQNELAGFDEVLQGRDDVTLLVVSTDPGWPSIAPLVPPRFASRIVFDPEGRVVRERYGTQLFPETWVIDPRGVIRARFDHTLEWPPALMLDYLQALRRPSA